jgi:hypothetical protein
VALAQAKQPPTIQPKPISNQTETFHLKFKTQTINTLKSLAGKSSALPLLKKALARTSKAV